MLLMCRPRRPALFILDSDMGQGGRGSLILEDLQ